MPTDSGQPHDQNQMSLQERNSAEGQGDALTYQAIGLAMRVHTELGPGLDEDFYHRRLAEQLTSTGVPYLYKPRMQLIYQGQVADVFEPDLVVSGRLILELKAQRGGLTAESLTQLLAYLKFWRISVGLLFDFAKERLIFQRVIHTEPELATFPALGVPAYVSDENLAAGILDRIRAIYQEHGLGYCDTTYRGLLLAGIRAAGIACDIEPIAQVHELGQTRLRCLVLNRRCVLTISALGEGLTAAQRAITQTYLRLLGLPWGIEVHFGKRNIALRFVSPSTSQIWEKLQECPRRFRATTDEEKTGRYPRILDQSTAEYSI